MKTKNTKSKKRFGPSKRGILIKGKWKAVELDPNIFANEALGEVVCFEELTDYSMIDANKVSVESQLKVTTGKKKQKKRKASSIESDEDIEEAAEKDFVEEMGTKKKKKSKTDETKNDYDESQIFLEDMTEDVEIYQVSEEQHDIAETSEKSKKKKRKKKKTSERSMPALHGKCDKVPQSSKKKGKNWSNVALAEATGQESDVSAWKDLFVPEQVLKALGKLGFSAPTPIQALALPPAIRDHLDVLGAAETGEVTVLKSTSFA